MISASKESEESSHQSAQVTLDPFAIPGYVGSKTLEDIEKRKEERTIISLFTGAGGTDLGMAKAGFETRVMVEWSKDACKTLRANWLWEELKKREHIKVINGKATHTGVPIWKTKEEMKKDITWYQEREPVILERDITTLTTKEILEAAELEVGEATLITGSPPCQGFSTVNIRRSIDDPRNQLFKEFVRVVREALPKLIFFENVPGMISSTKGKVIREICEEFANCGYNISWNILDAVYYGVPQYRMRVILIGKRIDAMEFPEVGNPRLFMGAMPGKISHPKWFVEQYKIKLTEQETTHNQPKQDGRKDKRWGSKKEEDIDED